MGNICRCLFNLDRMSSIPIIKDCGLASGAKFLTATGAVCA